MKKLLVFFLALASCTDESGRELKPKDFQQQIQNTADAVVVDVRTGEEVNKGFIEGAIHIDYKKDDFESKIAELDRDKTYFVYCGSGVRSSKAGDVMKELGFKKYYTLEGGIKAWKEADLPVAK
jgi:rhodanese-related sulfurtransferase